MVDEPTTNIHIYSTTSTINPPMITYYELLYDETFRKKPILSNSIGNFINYNINPVYGKINYNIPLINLSSGYIPLNLSLVYSNETLTNTIGNSWMFNYSQYLEYVDESTYSYIDGSGTKHKLVKTNVDNIYHDKVDNSLFLKVESSKYIITNERNLVMEFNIDKKLEKIKVILSDIITKELNISYNNDGNISSITDDLNRTCNITYTDTCIVVDYPNIKHITINKENNFITSITGLVEDTTKLLQINNIQTVIFNNKTVKNKYIDNFITPHNEKLKIDYILDDINTPNGVVNKLTYSINNNVQYRNEIVRDKLQATVYNYRLNNTVETTSNTYILDENGELSFTNEVLNNKEVVSNSFSNDSYYKDPIIFRYNNYRKMNYLVNNVSVNNIQVSSSSSTYEILLTDVTLKHENKQYTPYYIVECTYNVKQPIKYDGSDSYHVYYEFRENNQDNENVNTFRLNDLSVGKHTVFFQIQLTSLNITKLVGKLKFYNIDIELDVEALKVREKTYSSVKQCINVDTGDDLGEDSRNLYVIDNVKWRLLRRVNMICRYPSGELQTINYANMTIKDYFKTLRSYYARKEDGKFDVYSSDLKNVKKDIIELKVEYQKRHDIGDIKVATISENTVSTNIETYEFLENDMYKITNKTIYYDNLIEYTGITYDKYDKKIEEKDHLGNLILYRYNTYGDLEEVIVQNIKDENYTYKMKTSYAKQQDGNNLYEIKVDHSCLNSNDNYETLNRQVISIATSNIIKNYLSNNQEINCSYKPVDNYLNEVSTTVDNIVNKNEIEQLSLTNSYLKHNDTRFDYNYNINNYKLENISINNTPIVSYSYIEGRTENSITITYSNNTNLTYDYDIEGRLIRVKENGVVKAWNLYSDKKVDEITNNNITSTGKNTKLRKSYDGNTITKYYYDSCDYINDTTHEEANKEDNVYGRLNKEENPNYEVVYSYDDKNRLKKIVTNVGSVVNNFSIAYKDNYSGDGNKNNLIHHKYLTIDGFRNTIEYGYDKLSRISYKRICAPDQEFGMSFQYYQGSQLTSNYIKKITYLGTTFSPTYEEVTYDTLGNISSIKYTTGEQSLYIYYVYDSIGRLIRENNQILNKTYTYTYDSGGNILTKNIYNYTLDDNLTLLYNSVYEYDTTYKDLLVKVNNKPVTYNTVGGVLPTSYDIYDFTFGVNNAVTKVHNKETLIDIDYVNNAYGQRIKKTKVVATNILEETNYIYRGTQLLQERIQLSKIEDDPSIETPNFDNSLKLITYLYDDNSLVGFRYNSNNYFYIKDILGNIKYIVDNNYSVVCKYEYDSLGNHIVYEYNNGTFTENTNTSFIGNINPIRYKEYHYEKDLGYYYCNFRYYSPELGRFIQPADVSSLNPTSINGLNLYSYANNNPINIAYNNYSIGSSNSGGMVRAIGSAVIFGNNNYSDSIKMPSVYDTIGFASNFFAMLNGIKAAHYLKHISKITNNFDWFLNGFSKYNKISNYLGYMNAVVDGVNVWYLTGDFFKGAITGIYDWGALIMSSELGILLGGLIGGPVGAIIGTLTGIGIEFVIQIFKEEFVDWLDKKIDNLYNWISDKWGELING